MSRPSSYLRGVLLVLCAGVFWSFIPVGIRGFEEAGVWQILFYRSLEFDAELIATDLLVKSS